MKKIIVQKFGGTSVGSPERIKAVADICKKTIQREACELVVVVSAMGHTTDELCELMSQITQSPVPREYDMLLSSGEQVSTSLLSMALSSVGLDGHSMLGWQAGIKTSGVHRKAKIENVDTSYISSILSKGKIPVVAGFQGYAENKEVTTLGRSGSDTSAVALAVALGAERCDIYTDVDAVHTTDPRIVKNTGSLKLITYDEMLELASLGARVLHPRSVEIARNYNMPMRVRSSWKPENEGTLVVKNIDGRNETMIEGQKSVRGVALDKKHARLSILGVPDEPGIAYKIFGQLASKGISIDIIIQCASQDGIAELDFTVDLDDADKAQTELEKIAKEINAQSTILDKSIVKVSAVGAGMIDQPGVAAKMFKALADKKINIHMISTSEIRISCIVDEKDGELAVQTIHDAFNLDTVTE
ncbi:MAG: aspartate kinase [Candidatus Caenarcaniphilales bacterium]|nr:aspartate kinase [Candidatus Caenarcaniphilales bacterium]